MLWYAIAFMDVAPDTWGNTNRVVSNRVVSKGPLYPSKTEINIFVARRALKLSYALFLDTTPFICL